MGTYQLPPDLLRTFQELQGKVARLTVSTASTMVPLARVETTTTPTITNNNDLTVTFGSVLFDNPAAPKFWNPAQPTRLTIPVTGVYLMNASAVFRFNS